MNTTNRVLTSIKRMAFWTGGMTAIVAGLVGNAVGNHFFNRSVQATIDSKLSKMAKDNEELKSFIMNLFSSPTPLLEASDVTEDSKPTPNIQEQSLPIDLEKAKLDLRFLTNVNDNQARMWLNWIQTKSLDKGEYGKLLADLLKCRINKEC